VKATSVAIRVLLPPKLESLSGLELAARYIAAMPELAGRPVEPEFPQDVLVLEGPSSRPFDTGGVSLRHRSVLTSGFWATRLGVVRSAGGVATLQSSVTGGPEGFSSVWSFMSRCAENAISAMEARSVAVGSIPSMDGPLADMREVPIPRRFTPWVYVDLSSMPVQYETALRGLPDCTLRDVATGLVMEPHGALTKSPTPAFRAALKRIPIEPPIVYRHGPYPTPA
jgi:hypothetical protein